MRQPKQSGVVVQSIIFGAPICAGVYRGPGQADETHQRTQFEIVLSE